MCRLFAVRVSVTSALSLRVSAKSAISLNVGFGEFPEALGTSFAVWSHHEVFALLPVVALGPRNPCRGRRRDDHLLRGAPHGGAAAARAARRRFGSPCRWGWASEVVIADAISARVWFDRRCQLLSDRCAPRC